MTTPNEGGSYRREKDGTLTRVTFTDKAKPAVETDTPATTSQPEAPSIVETPPETEAPTKKGKA
jgi:hypothetical protein